MEWHDYAARVQLSPVTFVIILYPPANGRLSPSFGNAKGQYRDNCIAKETVFHDFSYDANETPVHLSRLRQSHAQDPSLALHAP